MRFEPFALRPDALHARMERLRWDFRKWDLHVHGKRTVAPGALVLTPAEHAEAVRVAERIARASHEYAKDAWRDEAATRLLGVPPALRALCEAEQSLPHVTRVDLFPTLDGWAASESNEDVPGGYNDALGLPAVFGDAIEKGLHVPGDLPVSLARHIAGDAARVGLVYATAYAEDLQVVELLADLLAFDGVETTLGAPDALALAPDGPRLAGEPVDGLYRFFPAEWYPSLPDLGPWRDALAAGTRVVNPFRAAWPQSKLAFAKLRDHDPGLAAHLPKTRRLDPDARRDALDDPSAWVLKPCFGRMGEGVVLGSDVAPDDWRRAVDGAFRSHEPWVVQRRFRPTLVEVEPGVACTPCLGAYVIDGKFAGYYSRFSNEKVVRYHATNVLTVVGPV